MSSLEHLKYEYIALRDDVYRNLCGTIYPSIVYSDLMDIRKEYAEAGGNINDLPKVDPPDAMGCAPYFPPSAKPPKILAEVEIR